MKAKNNGDSVQCAKNLFGIRRGEVPYDRLRGLSTKFIDQPKNRVTGILEEDMNWTLSRWEPRITLTHMEQIDSSPVEGDFLETLVFTKKGETDG